MAGATNGVVATSAASTTKPLAESHQQHLALYMECHLRRVTIMIEVTSRHPEWTHFNLDYSRMPAVALQW